MGLRLSLASLAMIMSLVCAVLFVSEYRVYQFTQSLSSLQARAATDAMLPKARSGWAQREMTQYCIDALSDQVFILFPQELQRQGYVSCLDLGDQLLAANPAHAEALTIRALAQTSLGAESADVQSDLIASQLAAPQLTWLADRRLSFVLSQPATEDWAALIESEALILLGSSIGLRRLAQIYANRPEHRAVLQASVELTSERVQRRFINRVRHALQESS